MPGTMRSSGESPRFQPISLQHLEHQPRHPVDARVAGGDDRHLGAVARALDGGARSADLFGHPRADDLLALGEVADQLDVRDVADDHVGTT
jgi:hypothetical protein